MKFVFAKEKDIDVIAELESKCFAFPFAKTDIEYEVKNNPYAKQIILYDDNDLAIGYVDYWITFDSSTIARICVLKEFRKMGYAKMLMEYVEKDLLVSEVSSITLEVRESNTSAIALYTSVGFIKVTIKPHYYSNGENAIYMVKGI